MVITITCIDCGTTAEYEKESKGYYRVMRPGGWRIRERGEGPIRQWHNVCPEHVKEGDW